MNGEARSGRGGGFRDLAELEAAELAETVARARAGAPDAGIALFDTLAAFALESRGRKRRAFNLAELEGAERAVLALLGLAPRSGGGRRPKAGPGSRADAAARLRALARLAALAGAPAPLLEFYAEAAAGIEAGADPARALALRKPRGRPPAEGPLKRAILDALTNEAKRAAIAEGESHLDALGIAAEEVSARGRRGRSEATAQRAIKRARGKPQVF